jgi:two-component system sensor histidine kinase UhpB
MSLRFRLAVLATTVFVAILVVGALVVVDRARRAVAEETQSTAILALRLLELDYTESDSVDDESLRERLVARIRGLENVRHLSVTLILASDDVPERPDVRSTEAAAPAWFVDWVRPEVTEFRRSLDAGDGPKLTIVVQADPADEIAESWQDARTVLGLVIVLSLVANVLFYVMIGHWLKPLNAISAAMDGVQHGDYRNRLPEFKLPELSKVAMQFNRMADVLEQSREENRLLAQKTLAIQEDERRALAHELHDELGQSISAITAVAVSINRKDAAPQEDVRTAARTIAEISSRIYSVVRGMMTRLRPVLLDEFGLVPALENLVDGWNDRSGDLFCKFNPRGSFDDLSDEVKIGVYRIVQECLTNVSKHSDAAEVGVSLERRRSGQGDSLTLSVEDNGLGFDPTHTRTGLGLLGMRERAHALGACFVLDTATHSGVRIRVDIPLATLRVA